MAKVLVPIAQGTEEMEAVIVIDVLRRAGAEVTVASVMPSCDIEASRGVKVIADCLLSDCGSQQWDMIVLPGGLPGADHLGQSAELKGLLESQLKDKKWLAAICASPAVVLGRNGLIEGRTATCHPAFQEELKAQAAVVTNAPVVVDENLITSQAPGTAMAFALKLVDCLFGCEKAKEVAAPMVTTYS